MEWDGFWVNLREDNKVSESKMAVSESNMAEFKMAAIIKLSQNEWVKFVFSKWWEPILASVSEFERKYYHGWNLDGQIQDGRFQDGCHHQVKWEWMSFSPIELVWVRVRMEWECFWVNLREDNKVSESNMVEFKMAAIIKLSQNEWVKFVFCKWLEQILASVSEFERKYYHGWNLDGQIQDGRIQDGCHHQVKWEWMSFSPIELVWVRVRMEWKCFWVNLKEDNKVSESKLAVSQANMVEFKMAAII